MITLKNFLEKFVGHNSEIILFDEEKNLQYRKEAQKNKEKFYKLEILWQGMDWEATDAAHEYFKIHTDVVPCPYINSRVVRVFPYDTDIVPILGIEIDVDWDDYEKQIKARNDFEVKLKGAKNESSFNEHKAEVVQEDFQWRKDNRSAQEPPCHSYAV